jgi:hypothetical protein
MTVTSIDIAFLLPFLRHYFNFFLFLLHHQYRDLIKNTHALQNIYLFILYDKFNNYISLIL